MYFTSIEASPESRWARVQVWPSRGVNAVGAGMEAVLHCAHGALYEAAHTLNDGSVMDAGVSLMSLLPAICLLIWVCLKFFLILGT